jgi:hypothetical protein
VHKGRASYQGERTWPRNTFKKTKDIREVLKFLLPLVNPNKLSRVTIQVASTMVDCLMNKNKTIWARVLEEVIRKQVTKQDKVSFYPPMLFTSMQETMHCLR